MIKVKMHKRKGRIVRSHSRKTKNKKVYTTDNGSRCSGYGVYPDGRKCKGCSDCKGNKVTVKEARKRFSENHSILKVK